MKLNLLPTTVSQGQRTKVAWVVSLLIALAGIGASIGMSLITTASDNAAKQAEAEVRPKAKQAADTSAYADTLVQKATPFLRNTSLAKAMISHNDAYPDLYNRVLPYVPSFFRITALQAAPIDDKTSTVTIQGVLKTYQQYADLMLALMRIPGAQTISRQGFQSYDTSVPQVTPEDQIGKPRGPNDPGPIPDNGLDRLAYYESTAKTQTYEGTGNFGSTQTERYAGPEASLVTVTLTIQGPNLQVPDVRGTLAQSSSDASASAPAASGAAGLGNTGFGGPPGMGGPGNPGGPPMGGPPMGGPPSGARGGGKADD